MRVRFDLIGKKMTKADWNHLYICIAFWAALIGVLAKLGCLAWKDDYPREVTYSRGQDAFSVLFGAVMVGFTWWLAWG